MKIGNREIGQGPPLLVAEVSANHCGDLSRAIRLIELAKASGADAVKFQAYEAKRITLDVDSPEFIIKDGPWTGWRLFDLYKKAQTPFWWFPKLAEHANRVGIPWFASAFDVAAVDMLIKLDAVAIKIASFEIVDLPLVRYANATGWPLIISTGMASDSEIHDAMSAAPEAMLMHCVSGYPTPVSEANLGRIHALREFYNVPVGLSDHSTAPEIPVAATALGAAMIERHFIINRHQPSVDVAFSMEPAEFRRMAVDVRSTWAALQARTAPSEASSRQLRRSLYVVQDMKAGDRFTPENIRSIRPGCGLPPKELGNILGKTAQIALQRGTALTWDMVNSVGRLS